MTARPIYRRNMSSRPEGKKYGNNEKNDLENGGEGSYKSKLVSQRSRTWKQAIQRYKPIHVRSCQNTNIINMDSSLSVIFM